MLICSCGSGHSAALWWTVVVVLLGELHADTSQTQVLQDLLTRYGDNSTISVPQLRALLALLSRGLEQDSSPATRAPSNSSRCLSTDTLAVFQITEQAHLNEQHLQELCPTMLQQLGAGSCRGLSEEGPSAENSPRPTDAEVWGYAFLSVTVVSLFSLTGVCLAPLMKTRYMHVVLTFSIALAIGTLFSTAVLQLLPEV